MSDLVKTIIQTRKTAEEIAIKSLENIDRISEAGLRDRILSETATHPELYPLGWYDPPMGGVAVLFAKKPFARLNFKTLRNEESWPVENSKFENESAGIVYLSPVDRKTNMIGDIGFTIYRGESQKIKEHIKKCFAIVSDIAQHVKVGMKFLDVSNYGQVLLQGDIKVIGWIVTTSSNPTGYNWGHTVPGSYENVNFGNSFKEIRDTIRNKRIYVNEIENFLIPETCAFTIETRLGNAQNPELPNVFFHLMVCFDNGKKTILNDFSKIFNTAGMEYMNK